MSFFSYRVLQLALVEERELSLSLKTDVETLSDNLEELQEKSEKQITELSRENEILRNQLKKYVSAVQLLKRENENISKETNDGIILIYAIFILFQSIFFFTELFYFTSFV